MESEIGTMSNDSETMEKINELGMPKGFERHWDKRKFRFRVTFSATARGTARLQENSFAYYDLATARKCYRCILLAFYKSRDVEGFAICLNHYSSEKWMKAIHSEAVNGQG